jgi:chorismate dehydratase
MAVIGAVPYLNGRPLVRWFWDTPAGRASGVRLVEAVPSRLSVMIENGEVSAALVSSVELFRRPGLTHAPNAGVVADGAVRSVRLFSRVPLDEIRSVALDTSSLTSVALVRILLAERFGVRPVCRPAAPNLTDMLTGADAALLIGDAGYREYPELGPLHILDLGAGWKELTGLPFVYAAWIGRPDALTPDLAAALLEAKNWGKKHLADIARAEYRRLDETYDRSFDYLTNVMRYDIGPREEEALALFGEKVREHRLV